MQLSDFDYDLPPELIAQRPAQQRDASRMLVMSRQTGACELRRFADLADYLHDGDCLVLNNTKVIPARLLGRRVPSGGRVEAFLLEAIERSRWLCMLRPARRLQPGAEVKLEAVPDATFVVTARRDDGTFEITFTVPDVLELLEAGGRVPLPPYIHREPDQADRNRYQTIYATDRGAVAAPTAGLHFTPEVLERVRRRGVTVAALTLHVGPGTFRPVQTERIEDHVMHEETYVLPPSVADAVNTARRRKGRIIAVGTTSVRVLETCAVAGTRTVQPQAGRTRLFLYPPARPVVTDVLLTNFHLPRSTLLMLVSTFSSVEHVLAAYRLAVSERMRFYSYGDCMLLV